MSYPFPPVVRKQYNWTFLRDVFMKFEYTCAHSQINDSKLGEIFIRQFGRKEVTFDKLKRGLDFHAQNDKVHVKASLTGLELHLKFPEYLGFTQAQEWYDFISSYFEILHISELSSIILIKYNELNYRLPLENTGVEIAMRQIFSANLIGQEFEKLSRYFKEWPRWEKELAFSDEKSDTRLTIIFGYSKDRDNDLEGALTMRTNASLCKPSKREEYTDNIERLNQLLDDAFHWSVTSDILKMMSEKR